MKFLSLATLCLTPFAAHASGRPEVLLYLANESAPLPREQANLDRIIGWLRSSDDPADRQLAEELVEDPRDFQEAVDAELTALEQGLTDASAAMFVTNRLAHEGVVLVKHPGAPLTRLPIHLAAPTALIESAPFIDEGNLDAFLSLAAAQFDPSRYDFVLVIASHGDEHTVLTPRVALNSEQFTRESLFTRLHDAAASGAFFERAGVTPQALLNHLAAQGHGFTVSLLMLHTCNAVIEQLPDAVHAALIAAHGHIRLDAVDFTRLPNGVTGALSTTFSTLYVPEPFERVDNEVLTQHRWQKRLRVAPYLLPLLAWVIGFTLWRRRK